VRRRACREWGECKKGRLNGTLIALTAKLHDHLFCKVDLTFFAGTHQITVNMVGAATIGALTGRAEHSVQETPQKSGLAVGPLGDFRGQVSRNLAPFATTISPRSAKHVAYDDPKHAFISFVNAFSCRIYTIK
jgi:hypothetical protein